MVDFKFPLAYPFIIMIILLYRYIENIIGGADLVIFLLLYSRYGFIIANKVLFIAALAGFFYSIVKQKKKIRFIPFIFIGFLFVIGI